MPVFSQEQHFMKEITYEKMEEIQTDAAGIALEIACPQTLFVLLQWSYQ